MEQEASVADGMSILAIGDIHGCKATLEALLARLHLSDLDQLVFIGDYIDRGSDSKGVIDTLIQLRAERKCTFLRGNHEAMMLSFLDRGESTLWEMNGGLATLESYRADGYASIPAEHEQFIRDTVLHYETEEYFFVHAGLKADLTIAENLAHYGEETFLWERDHLFAREVRWEKPVVCGHTPQRGVINRPNLICIDTGCVFHGYAGFGMLTAIRLPERLLIEQPYVG